MSMTLIKRRKETKRRNSIIQTWKFLFRNSFEIQPFSNVLEVTCAVRSQSLGSFVVPSLLNPKESRTLYSEPWKGNHVKQGSALSGPEFFIAIQPLTVFREHLKRAFKWTARQVRLVETIPLKIRLDNEVEQVVLRQHRVVDKSNSICSFG